MHQGSDASRLSGFERGDGDTEFEFCGFLRMEVAAAVAAQNLELFIDGLDCVGRDRVRRTPSG